MRAFWIVTECVSQSSSEGDGRFTRASKVYDTEAEAVAAAKFEARSGSPEVFILEPTMSFKAALRIDTVVDVPDIDNPVGDEKQ